MDWQTALSLSPYLALAAFLGGLGVYLWQQRTTTSPAARALTEQQAAQAALHQAHAELEQRVQARTAELEQANAALHAEMAERQRFEAFKAQSEAKYRTLFEAANDAIFLLEGAQCVDCNTRALTMFDCQRQQIIGQTPLRFSPAQQPDGRSSADHVSEKIRQALSGEPQFFQWQHCRYTGEVFEAEVSLNRIDLENQPFLLAIVRDVTERQRAAAENARLLYDLNERVKELTALHATAQHLQNDQGPVVELLQQIAALLPPAWQYPALTAARLTFAQAAAQTENFVRTPWCQQAAFTLTNGEQGAIEVVYLAECPPAAEGPFLAEERHLINSLAEMLRLHLERKQAATALRENEERLRLMIEHMPVMVDALDPAGYVRLWNRECERVTGYTAAEIVGNPHALELLYPDPAYRAQMMSQWATRGNDYRNWAWQLTTKAGAVRTIEWSNISAHVPLLHWQTWGVGVDITERRRAEEAEQRYAARMETLHAIDRAILAAHSPEETALAALTRIRQLVPCRRANVMLFDFQAQAANVLAVDANGQLHVSPGQRLDLAAFDARLLQDLQRGQTVMLADVQTNPDYLAESLPFSSQAGRAWLTLPLLVQSELIGALSLGREHPGPFSAEDIEIVREVADQIAIAIQQARLFAATERRLRELVGLHEIAQAFHNLTDVRETYGTLAARMAQLIGVERCFVMLRGADGWDRAQAPGYGVTDAELQALQWPAPRLDEMPVFKDYFARGYAWANAMPTLPPFFQALAEPLAVPNVLIGLLKQEKAIIGHIVMATRPGGFTADDARLLGVVAAQAAVVIHNAQLYQAEHAARMQTDVLLEIARTVSSTLSLREVMLRILHESTRVLPFISGALTVYTDDAPTLVALTGHTGREDAVTQISYEKLKDNRILKRLLSARQPLLIPDVDQHPEWVKYPETAYIRSWLGVPLLARDQVVGVLALDSAEPYKFTPPMLATAQALAAQAAIAIENARLFEAKQRAAVRMEILHNIDRAILAAQSPAETAQAALAHIRQLVACQRASVTLFDRPHQTVLLAVDAHGSPQSLPGARRPLQAFDLTIMESLKQGHPYLLEAPPTAAAAPAGFAQTLMAEGLSLWLATPLLYQGQLIGSLNLGRKDRNPFGPETQEIAREIADQLAIAIQQSNLLAETREALAREERLNAVTQTISSTLDLPTVLEKVMRLAAELVGAESAVLGLLAPDGERLDAPYAFNPPPPLSQRGSVPKGTGIAWHILTTGQSVLLADYATHPAALPNWVAAGVRAFMGVPLIAGETMLGVSVLFSVAPTSFFTARDLALFETVGRQAGVAIQNARLFAAEQRRVKLLTTLRELSLDLNAQLELPKLLNAILERMERLLSSHLVALYLWQPETQQLVQAAMLPSQYGGMGTTRQLGEGLVGQVAATGEALVIGDYHQWPHRHPEVPLAVRASIGVPIHWQGQVVGVIVAGDEQPDQYGPETVEALRLLADQVTVALQNARLFEQVRTGREQLQALSRQLVQVQEEERKHLARELHDEVGQMLTGLKLMLGVVPRLPPEKMSSQINEVLTVLNRLTERVHDLSLNLRPMMLDDLGLMSALLWLFDRFTAQTGVRVNFETLGLETRLPPEVETTTYRLVQEALTNVARYAETTEAWVRLLADGTEVRLQVQDAGRGFDVAVALTSGQRVGLTGMKERAALLGGWLHIQSAPGAGTEITATLPLQA